MSEESILLLERVISEQLRDIDFQMNNLEQEKAALIRALAKAKSANIKGKTRKNSVTRIAIETRVTDALNRRQTKKATFDYLYKDALGIDTTLKKRTFATHIHRMSKKEMIESAGYALWQLKEVKSV